MPDEFVDLRFGTGNLDTFHIRRATLLALRSSMPLLGGVLLDVGCGEMPYKRVLLTPPSRIRKYIGMDLQDSGYGTPDLAWDGRTIPLASSSVDCAMATAVFEHCAEPESVMREAARVMRPGGVLFFTVPFLWPLHCLPHDEYRFTPVSLERHLRNAGFAEVRLSALGGWDASLAQMLGLWVRRRGMPRLARRVLSVLAWPVVWSLLHSDNPTHSLTRADMLTVISGIATTPVS